MSITIKKVDNISDLFKHIKAIREALPKWTEARLHDILGGKVDTIKEKVQGGYLDKDGKFYKEENES